jgi:SOS-response transcriptional repressor LexA
MRRTARRPALPEWALQITSLRERLGINQAELARRMQCSAMTISRWERGLLQPSAEHFIQLGNFGDKTEAWFFWEKAGIQPSKIADALGVSSRSRHQVDAGSPHETSSSATSKNHRRPAIVPLPLLKATIGTHGIEGDRRSSLRTIAVSQTLAFPASWCPNPSYTFLLRAKGHSMEPLIHNGDILAVDSFQTERANLYGKLVIVASEHKGMWVSRLRRYDHLDVLEAENRRFDPVVLNKARGWRILGPVLWSISFATRL